MNPRQLIAALFLIGSATTLLAEEAAPDLAYAEKSPVMVIESEKSLLYKDVVYGPYDSKACTINLFVPKGDGPWPLYINLISGGWSSNPMSIKDGDEEKRAASFAKYTDEGFAVAIASHRSCRRDDVQWPDPLDDIARAVQYVRYHSKVWNIDPGRISMTGRSSGSHVTEMVAYTPDRADPQSTDPVVRHSSHLTCIVAYAGTYDLFKHFDMCRKTGPGGKPAVGDKYMHSMIKRLYGMPPNKLNSPELKQAMLNMSPSTWLHKDCPPTLLVHVGPADATSPDDPRLVWNTHTAINGLLMAQHLKRLGVPHKIILRPRKYPERTANELAWLRRWNGK